MRLLFTILSVLPLAFIAGCTTTRTYDTSEALLLKAIPVAVTKTMSNEIITVHGNFDPSSRTFFADLNLFPFGYLALTITWQPTSAPGRIRVTADASEEIWFTGTLINYDNPDIELEFHRQLGIALGLATVAGRVRVAGSLVPAVSGTACPGRPSWISPRG